MSMLLSLLHLPANLTFKAPDDFFRQIFHFLSMVDWLMITKISLFSGALVMAVCALLAMYRSMQKGQRAARARVHSLQITNNGNMPSSYLLRAVGLVPALEVHFFSDNYPLIAFSVPKKEKAAGRAASADSEMTGQVQPAVRAAAPSIIPNMRDPFEAVKQSQAMKKAESAQIKLGAASQLLGAVGSFLPKTAQADLKNQQERLSGVQHGLANVQNVPVSMGQKANVIGQNLDKLGVKDKVDAGMGGLKNEAVSGMSPAGLMQQTADKAGSNGQSLPDMASDLHLPDSPQDLSTDEGVSYAETPVLEPGAGITVDLRFDLKPNFWQAVTYAYKLEVRQHLLLNPGMSAPKKIINGVVSFPLQSRWIFIRSWLFTVSASLITAGVFIYIGTLIF